ncbi:MAG: type II toxin-antitoxin system RelE/ParE family toxin [Ferruginibacter sp.]
MIITFKNTYLENLYVGKPVKRKPIYTKEVILQFKKTVLRIEQADNSSQLKQFKSLNFEALKGNKKGLYSVRVNKQYRLEFKLENDKITLTQIVLIEELSKHYE